MYKRAQIRTQLPHRLPSLVPVLGGIGDRHASSQQLLYSAFSFLLPLLKAKCLQFYTIDKKTLSLVTTDAGTLPATLTKDD
uniref:Uncharacterized protein n=1 Tax=Plectus sambesii TaxID=2011161 RepID=A0A914WTD1_9BILA